MPGASGNSVSVGQALASSAPICTEPMPGASAIWPELIYRLIEHYKWEPQHLGIRSGSAKGDGARKGETLAVFYERIRRQEVPLNLLLALVLAWASSDTIRAILKTFELDASLPADEHLGLCHPVDAGYTQPDIWLQSHSARVFVELKWSATITLEQVQKYLCLHADLDTKFGPRRPLLLFLTRDRFTDCWRPRRSRHTGPSGLFVRDATATTSLPPKLVGRLSQAALDRYEEVKATVTYGFATWSGLHAALVRVIACLREADRHIEAAMIEGFQVDLARRVRDG